MKERARESKREKGEREDRGSIVSCASSSVSPEYFLLT